MKELHVGIDISKFFFDVHIMETGKDLHYDYTPEGVRQCLALLEEEAEVELVVMEATGGYEIPLAGELQDAGLPVAIVNPRRIRDYAKAAGIMAKTDQIDAGSIAEYGAKMQPRISDKIDENSRKLRFLVFRRDQLVAMRVAENNRLEHAFDREVARSIGAVIATVDKQIAKVEGQIADQIAQQPQLQKKADILESAPGVGATTASMLVATLPELGRANKKEISALVGVAPMNRDSGIWRGKRMTGGGRRHVRAGLFMPTLVAIRWNPAIHKFYQHLLEQGKEKMTAVIAAMHKLLIILNTMLKNDQSWMIKNA